MRRDIGSTKDAKARRVFWRRPDATITFERADDGTILEIELPGASTEGYYVDEHGQRVNNVTAAERAAAAGAADPASRASAAE
ncbi:hypothetical protein H4J02_06660 [Protaetiibacter sp. SSC-01]|uniref:hypothetical protein n=1 Tax=Protaetiibacter sp. SSC-01 TaxID=2759943 RepID=UPI001657582F|nr:hypothetical protein [Protaetiibacter sp. SSC-01]QNO38666.1 hypothetical protein H4J02_06660 [Protaetiibacter sp. SSC-01]